MLLFLLLLAHASMFAALASTAEEQNFAAQPPTVASGGSGKILFVGVRAAISEKLFWWLITYEFSKGVNV